MEHLVGQPLQVSLAFLKHGLLRRRTRLGAPRGERFPVACACAVMSAAPNHRSIRWGAGHQLYPREQLNCVGFRREEVCGPFWQGRVVCGGRTGGAGSRQLGSPADSSPAVTSGCWEEGGCRSPRTSSGCVYFSGTILPFATDSCVACSESVLLTSCRACAGSACIIVAGSEPLF